MEHRIKSCETRRKNCAGTVGLVSFRNIFYGEKAKPDTLRARAKGGREKHLKRKNRANTETRHSHTHYTSARSIRLTEKQ